MNTLNLTTGAAYRIAALALSSVFTLVLLVSVNQLANGYSPDAQMALNGGSTQTKV